MVDDSVVDVLDVRVVAVVVVRDLVYVRVVEVPVVDV